VIVAWRVRSVACGERSSYCQPLRPRDGQRSHTDIDLSGPPGPATSTTGSGPSTNDDARDFLSMSTLGLLPKLCIDKLDNEAIHSPYGGGWPASDWMTGFTLRHPPHHVDFWMARSSITSMGRPLLEDGGSPRYPDSSSRMELSS